ncbi:uncharacterized protein BX664DRAFT_313876 [Halteromyces radiatus]|uniref:uncharacterized protein n=1 Tax=Halteromyces radiatus TaxID=101107 RepID=UPI0022210004|nr:uncharacterized protein BX664DRAFT_313876 [Halteromyces radiatus]KAI8093874.1 hypothetical protein BX664DRAFT_313876 [Halteromyces radiatus]
MVPDTKHVTAGRPPPKNSVWGTTELVTTPFWEESGLGTWKYTPKVDPPTPQAQSSPTSVFSSRCGTAASRYATPSPVVAASAPSPTTVDGTVSLSDPESVKPAVKVFLQLNIELHPGVSAVLLFYETNDYRLLVREFAARHHLTITSEAEKSFAQNIGQMMANIRQQKQRQ